MRVLETGGNAVHFLKYIFEVVQRDKSCLFLKLQEQSKIGELWKALGVGEGSWRGFGSLLEGSGEAWAAPGVLGELLGGALARSRERF